MSVIIRLQNLPWSANALDIRQFFKGLSIPEGGVHIVGGEMGDAFIAFSTDEDARQAIMRDREKISEVQVRLLLSSRAEMQKVIEKARQQSLLALQSAGALPTGMKIPSPQTQQKETARKKSPSPIENLDIKNSYLQHLMQKKPQPVKEPSVEIIEPVPSRNRNYDADRERRRSRSKDRHRRSSSRERRRSISRERRRSRSRDRNDRGNSRRRRSRSPSRNRDWKGSRNTRRSRSRSRERSREHSRDLDTRDKKSNHTINRNVFSKDSNGRTNKDNIIQPKEKQQNPDDSNDVEIITPKSNYISPWSIPPVNTYSPSYMSDNITSSNLSNTLKTFMESKSKVVNPTPFVSNLNKDLPKKSDIPIIKPVEPVLPNFQPAATTTSINLLAGSNMFGNDFLKSFSFQNPYTVAQQTTQPKPQELPIAAPIAPIVPKIDTTLISNLLKDINKDKTISNVKGVTTTTTTTLESQVPEQPMAFAKTNPYAEIYPNLFAQAKSSDLKQNPQPHKEKNLAMGDTSSIKVSNFGENVMYSDLRKYFSGLVIPHNGIKMLNDKQGKRLGTAYIQFNCVSSAQKAILRNTEKLKDCHITVELVPDKEFESAEDGFRPKSRFDRMDRNKNENASSWDESTGGNNFNKRSESVGCTVLYIEDIPPLTTEQDIMRMFSSYTIVDILLTPRPENRKEFVAYVKFSREEEAKAAFDAKSLHIIGKRVVRITTGSTDSMEKAKEKIRLANEQLLKEEQSMVAELRNPFNNNGDETKRKKAMGNISNNYPDKKQFFNNNNNQRDYEEPPVINNPFKLPSIFDLASSKPVETNRENNRPSDPRLRRTTNNQTNTNYTQENQSFNIPNMQNMQNVQNMQNMQNMGMNNYNQPSDQTMNRYTAEDNYVIIKNCEYNASSNEIYSLFAQSNLQVKHVELLIGEGNMPAGEFIVEFYDYRNAMAAIEKYNNTQFRTRSLKILSITPQEIADRLNRPFLNYMPRNPENKNPFGDSNSMNMNMNSGSMNYGDNGERQNPNQDNLRINSMSMNRGSSNFKNERQPRISRFSNLFDNEPNDYARNRDYRMDNDMDYNNDRINCDIRPASIVNNSGIPAKFNRSGCVIDMKNVPFKADVQDILRFFGDFPLAAEDIIRRFNDDGSPTGDARIAFSSPDEARAALESRMNKYIFNRCIQLNIL